MLGSFGVASASRAATRARDEIVINADFVATELATITAPRAMKTAIWDWCADFIEGWGEISAYLDRVLECARKYQRMHPSSMRSQVEGDIDAIRSHMVKLLDATRLITEQTRTAAPGFDSGLVSILLTESATNIFNESAKFQDAMDKLVQMMKIDEADPYEGKSYPHWDFFCDKCGHPALFVTLIPEDARHPLQEGRNQALMCANHEIRIIGAPEIQELTKCLESRDFEAMCKYTDAALIHCRKCNTLYCWDDWSQIAPVYDGTFYDYTTGVCPNGHTATIKD